MLPANVRSGQQLEFPHELQSAQTTVSLRADSQQKVGDKFQLRGHVGITYRDMKLTADEVTYDDTTGEADAQGHVVFDDSRVHLEADKAQYNIYDEKGWFTNGSGYFQARIRARPHVLTAENPFYLRAKRVERQDEETFFVHSGSLSTCENPKCGWAIQTSQAKVQVGDEVTSRSAVFRFVGVPLFYSPFLANSIAPRPRRSGLLLPHIGTSTQKGFMLGEGVFWAINPSADLLLGVENYSVRGLARNGQFRARPSADSEVSVDYYGVNDKGSGARRAVRATGQRIRAVGEARNLGFGFRGVLDVDYISSLAFQETWSENFTQAVASEARQSGFLTKNFDAYSLNLYISRYQDFLCTATSSSQPCPASPKVPGNSVSIRQLPSVSFSGMDKQIQASPLYFSFDASAAEVGRTEPGFQTPDLIQRFDFHPALTLRPRPFWGFHFTPSAGVEGTYYGTSLRPDHHPIERGLGEFSADLRPPSFDKVFRKTFKGYHLKHLLEPDIEYRLIRATDREDFVDIVRFDETDVLTETHEVEYSLTNSLLARKEGSDASGDAPPAREVVSWRIAQKYYFDPTFGGAIQPGQLGVFEPALDLTGFAFARGRRLSPLVSVLKIAPYSNYDTELRADVSPNGGGVLNAGVTSHLHRGQMGLALTDFFINKTAALPVPLAQTTPLSKLTSFNLLRAVVTYGAVNRKGLSGAFGIDYNFVQGIAHQAVSQLSYNFGCFGLDFEYRRFNVGILRNEQQYRIALSLVNVGSFGNLKPRERLY